MNVSERVVTYEGPRARGAISTSYLVELADGSRVDLRANDPVEVDQKVADEIAQLAERDGQKVTVETQAAREKRESAESGEDS